MKLISPGILFQSKQAPLILRKHAAFLVGKIVIAGYKKTPTKKHPLTFLHRKDKIGKLKSIEDADWISEKNCCMGGIET